MAVDEVNLFCSVCGVNTRGISFVGQQEVGIEEVAPVFVTVGEAKIEDVLVYVVASEGLGKLGAITVAEVGVAPVCGIGPLKNL